MNMDVDKLRQQFKKYGQEHVFRFWPQLNREQQEQFSRQLHSIDLALVARLAETFVLNPQQAQKRRQDIVTAEVIPIPESEEENQKAERARKTGEEYLCAGKVGVILVAGGQGTRLGYSGSKGKYPVTPVKGKSLFQLHAEKILALSRKHDTSLPWYIMSSAINDAETRAFFQENQYFGLAKKDLFFFQQQMIPAVDQNGKLFLAEKGKVFTNPNGHGGTLQALKQSGALEDMAKRGIEELFYFQVDNVLTRICDPVFLGYHVQQKAEMSSKVLAKRDPYEKLGVVGYRNGKLSVIEYSDLSKEEMEAKTPDGRLKFNAGSIAIHNINRTFIKNLTNGNLVMPYHRAHKKIPYIDEAGNRINPGEANGNKFEMFIFDALQYTTQSVVMEVARAEEFSPVKNAAGEDSAETARQALCNLYGNWLKKTGVPVKRKNGNVVGRLEISPLFAGDEKEFVAKCPPDLTFFDGLYLG